MCQIHFVSNKQLHTALPRFLFYLRQPKLLYPQVIEITTFKALTISNIVNDKHSICSIKVAFSQAIKSFLSCSVPYAHSNFFIVNKNHFLFQIYTQSWIVKVRKCVCLAIKVLSPSMNWRIKLVFPELGLPIIIRSILTFSTSIYILLIANNFIMYNAHTALKQLKSVERTTFEENKEKRWSQRYTKEVRTRLLVHYDKRIKAFIHQMEDKPIIVNPERKPLPILPHFTFKNNEDFSSIFTSSERMEIKRNQQILFKKYGDSTLAFKSISSQCKYRPNKVQFRIRNKSKQLKINDKKKQMLYKQFISQRKQKSAIKPIKSNAKSQVKTNQSNISISSNKNPSLSSLRINDDNNSEYSKQEISNQQDRQVLEKEAVAYQKSKEIRQKKVHFKKIINLAQNEKDQHQKKALMKILMKCGLRKNIYFEKKDESENDVFV